MSNYDQEQMGLDAVIADLRRASALQVIGWTLLVFDALIIGIWVLTGYRSGSDFWLYWFVIEGVVGLGLVMAGSYLKTRAGRGRASSERNKIRRIA